MKPIQKQMVERSLAFNERQERESVNTQGEGVKALAHVGLAVALAAVGVGLLLYWALT